jgi:folylpolyglutamate synthase/dihydrofolate synthase
VEEALFRKIEKHYQDLSIREGISASNFEILTATAFHIFNEAQVKIGIVEVGMGGTLDATNVLNNQAVSVISKIARDHQGFLGNTLEEIALHKAGILRPDVPYLINPNNEGNVQDIIDEYARSIGAGPRLEYDPPGFSKMLFQNGDRPPNPTAQRENVMLAARSTMAAMESLGREMKPFVMSHILHGSKHFAYPGRLDMVRVPPVFGEPSTNSSRAKGRHILVDGAHNPDAAQLLHEHVGRTLRRREIPGVKIPSRGWPITWVLAMTEGKDAKKYLTRLLKRGDNVITTTFGPVDGMPWVKPMDPRRLLDIATSVDRGITGLVVAEDGPLRALCAAKHLRSFEGPIVLTGSLYLAGDFYRDLQANYGSGYWENAEFEETRKKFTAMLEEEKHRVNQLLSFNTKDDPFVEVLAPSVGKVEERDESKRQRENREKRRAVQEEIEALDREMELLTAEEQRLKKGHKTATDTESSSPRIHNRTISPIEEGAPLPSKYKSKTLENGAILRFHKTVWSSLDEEKRVEPSPPILNKPLKKDDEYKTTKLENGVKIRFHKVEYVGPADESKRRGAN